MDITLDLEQTKKAAIALLDHVHKAQEQEKQLIIDRKYVWLIVATHTFSEDAVARPARIPLKHPIYEADAEICLFTKDPQSQYKKLLKEKEVTKIDKVIGLKKLRKKFASPEKKRKLCDGYELFLADDKIIVSLPKLLGKYFFKRKKQPISVRMGVKDLKAEIDKACTSTYMHISPGTCFAVKVATTEMIPEQVTDNLEIAVPCIIAKIPGEWQNDSPKHVLIIMDEIWSEFQKAQNEVLEIGKEIKQKLKSMSQLSSGSLTQNSANASRSLDELEKDYHKKYLYMTQTSQKYDILTCIKNANGEDSSFVNDLLKNHITKTKDGDQKKSVNDYVTRMSNMMLELPFVIEHAYQKNGQRSLVLQWYSELTKCQDVQKGNATQSVQDILTIDRIAYDIKYTQNNDLEILAFSTRRRGHSIRTKITGNSNFETCAISFDYHLSNSYSMFQQIYKAEDGKGLNLIEFIIHEIWNEMDKEFIRVEQ
ncbi:2055_t:CDS:10 [Paraglomus brasilianum]|uniref:2055_t:CDS:1 n=1 Tax=Paraglomus brasilianum TaxID=144538 RepID=A0A9N9FM10_9GLOM|nr:2055_t:CDS:10 [Paraglomus brasilianum]